MVGAGGLGSPAALYLAAAGVGTLGIVDPDRVELSNLQRQLLHATADVGRLKTESAMDRLQALNPEVRLEPHPVRLAPDNAGGIVAGYDLVVDGSDNLPTRYLVNEAALAAGIPWVYGAVLRWEGHLSVFAAPGGPCYRCFFRDPPPAAAVPGCAESGVMGALPGIIGSFQALEAIKWIVSEGSASPDAPLVSAVGRLLVVDAARLRIRELHPRRDPTCPACGDPPHRRPWIPDEAEGFSTGCETAIPARSPRGLEAALASDSPPLVLDVREGWEWDAGNLAHRGALHLPPGALDPASALPVAVTRALEAAQAGGRGVVVVCRAGGRSLHAAMKLRDRGVPRVENLEGGLLAWAAQVEPELPVA